MQRLGVLPLYHGNHSIQHVEKTFALSRRTADWLLAKNHALYQCYRWPIQAQRWAMLK
jgi:hypothetical protein